MNCRMGFDLKTKIGWKNLFWIYRHKGYKRKWRVILSDTFMPLVCLVLKHKPYGIYPEVYCTRCWHYIKGAK